MTVEPAVPVAWSTDHVRDALPAAWRFEQVAEIDSTNTELLRRFRDGWRAPMFLQARQQLAGRGRLGRVWVSAEHDSVYLSLLVHYQKKLPALAGLSIALGVAAAESISAWGPAVQLKWPNDLQVAGRKLGGILLEVAGEDRGVWLVAGIGVNINLGHRDIDQAAIDLQQLGVALTSDMLSKKIAEGWQHACERFATQGLAPFLARYASLDALMDCPVDLHIAGQIESGWIARGIDADGALQLQRSDTGARRLLQSGEVTAATDDVRQRISVRRAT